ncbi:hypothetical protein PoB_000052400 [Plakobranchus ocellatus]|uniref:Uncharacterized protein n=1 Tax=Plakobranchus ocellatus TaxID=259542 RepID=A0AAV3XW87_9GAST|nr:hypothetical protein PoB_000052400 [Plakobranchus ocellatus]
MQSPTAKRASDRGSPGDRGMSDQSIFFYSEHAMLASTQTLDIPVSECAPQGLQDLSASQMQPSKEPHLASEPLVPDSW